MDKSQTLYEQIKDRIHNEPLWPLIAISRDPTKLDMSVREHYLSGVKEFLKQIKLLKLNNPTMLIGESIDCIFQSLGPEYFEMVPNCISENDELIGTLLEENIEIYRSYDIEKNKIIIFDENKAYFCRVKCFL